MSFGYQVSRTTEQLTTPSISHLSVVNVLYDIPCPVPLCDIVFLTRMVKKSFNRSTPRMNDLNQTNKDKVTEQSVRIKFLPNVSP
jgi:hypothetical protein